MTVLDYSNRWLEGEITEGWWILAFGIITIVVAACLWKLGMSPTAKSLIVPTFVAGMLMSATGAGMVYSGQRNKTEFAIRYHQSSDGFLKSEVKRVDGFVKMYPWSPVVCGGIFIIAIVCFALTDKVWVKGWSIAAMYLALALTVIDYFSKENGESYHDNLILFEQQKSTHQ